MGQFHAPGSATPSTCLPCHAGERPTSTAGWTSTTYKNSPFDYVTNAAGIAHGDGQDCATCHAGPGTGAWGGTQNWSGGHFAHGSVDGRRNDLHRLPLDPATRSPARYDGGRRDHADRVRSLAERHRRVLRLPPGHGHRRHVRQLLQLRHAEAAQRRLEGWPDLPRLVVRQLGRSVHHGHRDDAQPIGREQPGHQHQLDQRHALQRDAAHLARRCRRRWPPGRPPRPTTPSAGTATRTPTAPSPPTRTASTTRRSPTTGRRRPARWRRSPQPTSHCADCHPPMLPTGIVEKSASSLQAMDHGVSFTSAVTIGGVSVTKVSQMDCSTCHKSPGATWSDGVFHANIGAAMPKDCVSCHYMAMADATKADVKSGTNFTMKHGSTQLTFQTCQTCHPSAFAKASSTPHRRDAVADGRVPRQRRHAALGLPRVPRGLASRRRAPPTQSAISYTFALGGTTQQRRAVDEPRLGPGRRARTASPATRPTPRRPAAPGASRTPSTPPSPRPRPARSATASPTAAARWPAPRTTSRRA